MSSQYDASFTMLLNHHHYFQNSVIILNKSLYPLNKENFKFFENWPSLACIIQSYQRHSSPFLRSWNSSVLEQERLYHGNSQLPTRVYFLLKLPNLCKSMSVSASHSLSRFRLVEAQSSHCFTFWNMRTSWLTRQNKKVQWSLVPGIRCSNR